MDEAQLNKISEKILNSPKYKSFYKPTIEKVIREIAQRYKPKQVEEMTRKKLHQMWGAYLNRPNYTKALEKLTDSRLTSLLYLQSSTSEREDFLEEFYEKIFTVAENPQKVVEYGCGINALTVMQMPGLKKYTGFDLDHEMIDFINEAYQRAGVSGIAEARVGDILIDQPIEADLTLMFKLVPLLERQEPGSTARIVNSLPSKYAAISYPTKSLSGKEKGMEKNYTTFFEELASQEGWHFDRIDFDNEVVFVVKL